MKLRKVAWLTGLVASVVALSACGSSSSSTSSSESDGPVKISYAIWDSKQEAGIRKIADEFEKENPNIKIDIQVSEWGAYWTMLEAGATGGSLPDTFWMHSNEIYRYGNGEMLLNLNDYIKNSEEIDLSNYPEGLNSIYNVNDNQYALPKDYDTIGLWYNKKMFDEAGLAYPDETWTWDTLKDAAKKLTKSDKSQYGIVAPLHNQEGYYNFVYQNEGEIISADKKKSGYDEANTVEALKYYFSFVKEGLSPEITDRSKTIEYLQNGQAAMGLFGSWNINAFSENDYIRENFDVAVLPTGKKRATIFNGLGNAIAASTKHPEQAWKWVEFLSSKKGQELQAELGVAISAYNGTASTWVNSNKDFAIQNFVEMIDYAQIRPYSNSTTVWEEKAYEELKNAYIGTEDVETAAKATAKMMNSELSSE